MYSTSGVFLYAALLLHTTLLDISIFLCQYNTDQIKLHSKQNKTKNASKLGHGPFIVT